jgi:hypothetical protein
MVGPFRGRAYFGSIELTSRGSSDVFVAKVASDGSFVWAVSAGGPETNISGDTCQGVAVDSGGNIVITGSFNGAAVFGPIALTSNGWHDAFIAKLDADGNFIWAKKAGGQDADEGRAIAVDAQGNCVVTGAFGSTALFGNISLTSSGDRDIFVARLSRDGDFLSAARAGGTGNDQGFAVAVKDSGKAMVAGNFSNTATFGSATLTSSGGYDIFVAEVGPNCEWSVPLKAGGPGDDFCFGLALKQPCPCLVTGAFRSTAYFGQITLTSAGDKDAFVARLGGNTPPTAHAGSYEPYEQEGTTGTWVPLYGGASSDPDGDPLTYRWTWPGGSATGVNPTITLPLGTTTVTLVVNDGQADSEPDTVAITVQDTTPPVLVVPSPIVVEQATADGTRAEWECLAADVCDAEVDVVCEPPSGSVFPLGVTTVTCTATDDSGNQTVKSFTVTVRDTTPPAIESVWATPNVLWPPNHKMVDIAIGAVVGDMCDAAPAWKIVGVASNEPVNGLGDGDTAPDWAIMGEHSLKLRAERGGKGSGRVYTITIQATDASGNAATAQVTVSVPHDQRK